MNKIRIAILFGGRAEEHPVSVKSAQEVVKNLDKQKYEPFYIGITRQGAWKLCDGPGEDWENGNCRPAILSPDSSAPGILVLGQEEPATIPIDVVFPVLHGRLGEGGSMQGLLELSGVPYVGCDVQSSVLCMDKSLAYTVVRDAGIATPTFWTFMPSDAIDPEQFTYPIFVKPARSGSSFGVEKVSRKEDLMSAVHDARQFDPKVLIEEPVAGSEVGCAVLGNGVDLATGEPDRIHLNGNSFFKIHQETDPTKNTEIVVPADISADERALVLETAKAIYRALGCGGLARIDMFLKEDGTVALNEVNTLPGFVSYSRYPQMMAAAGVSFSEVIDRAVKLAMQKQEHEK